MQLLCPARCSSTICLQTLIRFLLPAQWQGVAVQGLQGLTLSLCSRGYLPKLAWEVTWEVAGHSCSSADCSRQSAQPCQRPPRHTSPCML